MAFEPSAAERFLYWISERIAVQLKRKLLLLDPPWSEDPVFHTTFFTNPYREWDKTTVWFAENIRKSASDPLMSAVIFRWFNLIATGEFMIKHNLIEDWNCERAISLLNKRWWEGHTVFTSAYIIQAGSGNKIRNVCRCIDHVWQDRHALSDYVLHSESLEASHARLMQYPYLGGFMAYELVTDLRHTHLLDKAKDIMTWANPGPGCNRGLRRLCGLPARGTRLKGANRLMQKLLPMCPNDFEMREVEHSLCEFDKYERVRTGQGRSKRKFKGALR